MGMSESTLLMAVLDADDDGRVTIHDVLQVVPSSAVQNLLGRQR
jgi:hypothetical protein